MDKEELLKLRAFLRKSFGSEALSIVPGQTKNAAQVRLGESLLGTLEVDDEDGDRSFAFEMKIPVERAEIQSYLRKRFENDKLTVASRLKKTDSVEVSNAGEFLGVASADDPKGKTFTLQIAILDIDLEEI